MRYLLLVLTLILSVCLLALYFGIDSLGYLLANHVDSKSGDARYFEESADIPKRKPIRSTTIQRDQNSPGSEAPSQKTNETGQSESRLAEIEELLQEK